MTDPWEGEPELPTSSSTPDTRITVKPTIVPREIYNNNPLQVGTIITLYIMLAELSPNLRKTMMLIN